MLNAHCARGRPFCPLWSLYAVSRALAATVESLVTDVQYTVLIRFPIIAQRSKGVHYFHRVVGLVVNIRQWIQTQLSYMT